MFAAVWTRLELATPCVTGRYSNQLNYQTVFPKKQMLCLSGARAKIHPNLIAASMGEKKIGHGLQGEITVGRGIGYRWSTKTNRSSKVDWRWNGKRSFSELCNSGKRNETSPPVYSAYNTGKKGSASSSWVRCQPKMCVG